MECIAFFVAGTSKSTKRLVLGVSKETGSCSEHKKQKSHLSSLPPHAFPFPFSCWQNLTGSHIKRNLGNIVYSIIEQSIKGWIWN